MPDQVLTKIVTRTIQSPDDQEVRQILLKERSDSRVILKFVLEEYEKAYVRANKYDPPPTIAATLEHVLPQHLTVQWQNYVTLSEHDHVVGLLGNLAPLSEAQNKGLRDQPWAAKRKRFRGSNFKLTQAIAASPTWDAAIIRKRTEEMIGWIISQWPELSSIT